MEKKLKISDFAGLVGTSQKTIYSRLSNSVNLPVNEQLKSVSEKVRGREITFIVTSDEQIQLYQSIFSSLPVNEGNCEENLTYINPSLNVNNNSNNVNNPVNTEQTPLNAQEIIEKIMTLNEVHREELNTVNKELIAYKSKVNLLEYHEGREGLQINEINELKKDNKELIKVNYNQRNIIIGLISVIILLIIVITAYITFNSKVNELQQQVTNDKKNAEVQEVVTPPAPQPMKINKKD